MWFPELWYNLYIASNKSLPRKHGFIVIVDIERLQHPYILRFWIKCLDLRLPSNTETFIKIEFKIMMKPGNSRLERMYNSCYSRNVEKINHVTMLTNEPLYWFTRWIILGYFQIASGCSCFRSYMLFVGALFITSDLITKIKELKLITGTNMSNISNASYQ